MPQLQVTPPLLRDAAWRLRAVADDAVAGTAALVAALEAASAAAGHAGASVAATELAVRWRTAGTLLGQALGGLGAEVGEAAAAYEQTEAGAAAAFAAGTGSAR